MIICLFVGPLQQWICPAQYHVTVKEPWCDGSLRIQFCFGSKEVIETQLGACVRHMCAMRSHGTSTPSWQSQWYTFYAAVRDRDIHVPVSMHHAFEHMFQCNIYRARRHPKNMHTITQRTFIRLNVRTFREFHLTSSTNCSIISVIRTAIRRRLKKWPMTPNDYPTPCNS